MLLFPLAANAAHDELEVFDFRLCVNWSISTDVSQRQGASYTRIKALRDQRSDGADWGIYEAEASNGPSQASTYKHGLCRWLFSNKNEHRSSAFTCLGGGDFPIAGLTFSKIKQKGALPSFKCTKGCTASSVEMLHDMGYENEEGQENVEYLQNHSRFQKLCRSGKTSR